MSSASLKQPRIPEDIGNVLSAWHSATGVEPKSSGGGWRGPCPLCGGSDASDGFAVDLKNGHVLARCFKGCDQAAVADWLRHVGLAQVTTVVTCGPADEPAKQRKAYPSVRDAVAALAKSFGRKGIQVDGYEVRPWDGPGTEDTGTFAEVRFNLVDGKKEVRPYHRTDRGWEIGKPPGKSPLYRLNEIQNAILIVFAEGPRKADVLHRMGFHATAVFGGVGGVPQADLTPILNRNVIVWPDHDAAGQKMVKHLVDAGIKNLRVLNIEPIWSRVTLEPLPEKADIVDLVEAALRSEMPDFHGLTDGEVDSQLLDVITRQMIRLDPVQLPASEATKPETDGPATLPFEQVDDPHRLARAYLTDRPLRCWQGGRYRYNGACYGKLEDGDVQASITAACKREFDAVHAQEMEKWQRKSQSSPGTLGTRKQPPTIRKVTRSLVGNVTQAVDSLARVYDVPSMPAWLNDADGGWNAGDVVAFQNVLLHIPSFLASQPAHRKPTPDYFSTFALPYDYQPDAPEPMEWLRFLNQVFGDDQEAIDLLQEWCGYILTGDTSQQKILAMIGPRRAGKGTISRVMNMLVGERNVIGPTLSSMASPFGLQPFLGKYLATFADARLSGRADLAIVTERLLAIAGEDAQTVDCKHQPSVTTVLKTRLVYISNEMPRLSDASNALAGRFLILRFTKTFYDREDHGLFARVEAERSGIMNWAMAGLLRLRHRGRFVQPASGKELAREMEELSSPISAFIKDRCITDSTDQTCKVRCSDLFTAWCQWCTEQGKDHPGDAQNFARQLRAALPELQTKQSKADGGKRYFIGIRLR